MSIYLSPIEYLKEIRANDYLYVYHTHFIGNDAVYRYDEGGSTPVKVLDINNHAGLVVKGSVDNELVYTCDDSFLTPTRLDIYENGSLFLTRNDAEGFGTFHVLFSGGASGDINAGSFYADIAFTPVYGIVRHDEDKTFLNSYSINPSYSAEFVKPSATANSALYIVASNFLQNGNSDWDVVITNNSGTELFRTQIAQDVILRDAGVVTTRAQTITTAASNDILYHLQRNNSGTGFKIVAYNESGSVIGNINITDTAIDNDPLTVLGAGESSLFIVTSSTGSGHSYVYDLEVTRVSGEPTNVALGALKSTVATPYYNEISVGGSRYGAMLETAPIAP